MSAPATRPRPAPAVSLRTAAAAPGAAATAPASASGRPNAAAKPNSVGRAEPATVLVMPGFNPGITVFEPSLPTSSALHGSERRHPARSKMLIYAGAVTCGVLAALALQIYLSGAGFDLAALWENLLSARPRQLRTTGPWWAIAGGLCRERRDRRGAGPPPLPLAPVSSFALGPGRPNRATACAYRPFRRGGGGTRWPRGGPSPSGWRHSGLRL